MKIEFCIRSLLLLGLFSTIQSDQDCTTEVNIHYPGNDISTPTTEDSWYHCRKKCNGQEGCNFWTFRYNDKQCWLKTSDQTRTTKRAEGLISGNACSGSGNTGCQNGKGGDYRGTASKTKSSFTCQKWSSQSPRRHSQNTKDKQDKFGLGDHNYCRNPGNEAGVWCYTVNGPRWESCDVPVCEKGRGKNDDSVENHSPLFIDIAKEYGVTYEGLTKAISKAQTYFLEKPYLEVILHITSGIHTLKFPEEKSTLDFTGPQPGNGGRLVFEGEGINNTVLEVDPYHTILKGKGILHLTVRNIQFRRSQYLVSQGVVKEVGRGFVVLDLEKGFPDIEKIFDTEIKHGKFLRKYTKENQDCKIVEEDNTQIAYKSYTPEEQGAIKFHLKRKTINPSYRKGDLVGVKSKCCTKQGLNAYRFCGGDDLIFENVMWRRQSRGVIKCGISNVRFTNITIDRIQKNWCMSTPDGGPQIGQPDDINIRNIVVDNLMAKNTGDDSVAFFNVESGGEVKNCQIRDSFAAGIFLFNSGTTILQNNVLERSSCSARSCKKRSCPRKPCAQDTRQIDVPRK